MAEKEFVASVTIPLSEYNSMKVIYDAFNKNKTVYSTAWDYRGVTVINESETVKIIAELLVTANREAADYQKRLRELEEKLNKKPFP